MHSSGWKGPQRIMPSTSLPWGGSAVPMSFSEVVCLTYVEKPLILKTSWPACSKALLFLSLESVSSYPTGILFSVVWARYLLPCSSRTHQIDFCYLHRRLSILKAVVPHTVFRLSNASSFTLYSQVIFLDISSFSFLFFVPLTEKYLFQSGPLSQSL